MTPRIPLTAFVAAVALTFGAQAQAQNIDSQIAARQGMFQMNGVSLGILAGMVRGRIDYDAELAQAAADNLVTVSQFNMATLWPEGSDSDTLDSTAALPAIWENYDDFLAKFSDFGEAAVVMQAAAGQGTDAIGAALGGLGGTCGACHDSYQKSR